MGVASEMRLPALRVRVAVREAALTAFIDIMRELPSLWGAKNVPTAPATLQLLAFCGGRTLSGPSCSEGEKQ